MTVHRGDDGLEATMTETTCRSVMRHSDLFAIDARESDYTASDSIMRDSPDNNLSDAEYSLPLSGEEIERRELISLADVCFEMFHIRELKRPHLILPELEQAFPEFSQSELLQGIAMALTWRRILRDAGRPMH